MAAPSTSPESALPSVAARVLAFASILLGGAAGALIAFSFATLQCRPSCGWTRGLWMWGGSVVGALGVSVVAVLTLRALGEWRTIRDRPAQPSRSRR